MEENYILNDKSIIINFSESYCKTESEVLSSDTFKRVWETYLKYLNRSKNERLIALVKIVRDPVKSFVNLFKVLLSFSIREVMEMSDAYRKILTAHETLYELIESFYDFWRHLERYGVMRSEGNKSSIESLNFIDASSDFTALILKVYRTICQKVYGTSFHIYRQLPAGINASIQICDNPWTDKYEEYSCLSNLSFVNYVLIRPTFIAYSQKNTRNGLYFEVKDNELKNLSFNKSDWFCYPAHVGSSLAYVYFHRDYMSHGIALSNLFEFVHIDEIYDRKPDLIYIFGAPVEGDSRYYYDEKNDIYVGLAPYGKEIDYFGYMKKMLLTLHNVKMIKNGYLPIHGACVNITLKNGIKKTLVMIGDSGAGKSESLEALRSVAGKNIVSMQTIFDDMGTFKLENGKVMAYGTEVGAFVRLDDLENGYAYKEMDRAIFLNPDKVNARIVLPVATYPQIMKGYEVDMLYYANNYSTEKGVSTLFDNPSDAIKVFKAGARVAKGTTSEKGLVTSYFANPFGPTQCQEECDKLLDTYFNALFSHKKPVGEIHTRLAVSGMEHEGPHQVAKFLYSLLDEKKSK